MSGAASSSGIVTKLVGSKAVEEAHIIHIIIIVISVIIIIVIITIVIL